MLQRYKKGAPYWGTPKKKLRIYMLLNIQIFDIRCYNPQRLLHMHHTRKHFFVVGGVGDVGEHYDSFT